MSSGPSPARRAPCPKGQGGLKPPAFPAPLAPASPRGEVGVYYFRGDELITINPKYPEEITHMFIGACDKLFDSSTDALHWIDYNAAEYTAPVRVSVTRSGSMRKVVCVPLMPVSSLSA